VENITFNARLTGIEQSSEYAIIADRIDKINVRVGDHVQKDSVIMTFPTDNPSANYYQAKVQFENARATYHRMENFYQSGGLSQQDLDNARAAYEVAKANWDAICQAVEVRAPFAGQVTGLYVSESDNVEKEDELFTISRTDRLKAEIWIPERDINRVHNGQIAHATWQGRQLTGRVTRVDMAITKDRQAFGAIVEFDNPDLILRYGVTADIAVETYSKPDAIITARKNIGHDNDGDFAYIYSDGHAELRRVKLGNSYQLSVEITDGIQPGDSLITAGIDHLEAGVKARIIENAASTGNTHN